MGSCERHSAGLLTTAAALLLGACASSALADRVPRLPHDQRCGLAEDERRWLREALAAWPIAEQDFLRRRQHRVPQIITYDSRCSYTLAPPPASPRVWSVVEHRGEITLPNGATLP
jgi:hypothetical protein